MRKRKTIIISCGAALFLLLLLSWKFTKSPEYIIMTGGSSEKRKVIHFLHKKPRWRALRMLNRLLEDEHAEVRLLAAGCCGEYGYTELSGTLARMSDSDTDESVRAQCLYRAVQLRTPDSETIIRAGLARNQPAVILSALASVSLLENPDPSLFLDFLKHDNGRVREEALGTAVKLKAVQAVPVLASDLDSEDLFPLPRLLDALQNITGVNHGLDAEAWIEWYSAVNKP